VSKRQQLGSENSSVNNPQRRNNSEPSNKCPSCCPLANIAIILINKQLPDFCLHPSSAEKIPSRCLLALSAAETFRCDCNRGEETIDLFDIAWELGIFFRCERRGRCGIDDVKVRVLLRSRGRHSTRALSPARLNAREDMSCLGSSLSIS